jgi:hypothetical protein
MAHRALAWLLADEVEGGEMGRCSTRKKGMAALLTGEEGRRSDERRCSQLSALGERGAPANGEAVSRFSSLVSIFFDLA